MIEREKRHAAFLSVVRRRLRDLSPVACLLALVVLCITTNVAAADELTDRIGFWKSQGFLCKGTFPSKYDARDPEGCDDGDMTLFNGLLCLSGEQIGCDAVQKSQGGDGRWWRSPRRVGWELGYDVSFSPDQALGVLGY